jgi:RHS repeat-associated protein
VVHHVDDMRDASGQMYRPNRYDDPQTGQFTQPDPIGIAGGLNAYGFAEGDPVTYADPYGLCPNPLAGGWGSLQCAMEDIIGAVRNAPKVVADRFRSSDGRQATRFAAGLASIPFTVGPVGRTAGGIRILEREGNHIIGAFNVAKGEARFVGEIVREGDDLILRGAHIEGDATVREVFTAAREFGREQGAKRVIVQGGRRTTGANPGHIPRPLTIETGL